MEICYNNRLTQLWRVRSPTVCLLQAGEPGTPAYSAVWVWGATNVSLRVQEPENRGSDIWGQENMNTPAQQDKEREGILPSSVFLFNSGPQQIG